MAEVILFVGIEEVVVGTSVVEDGEIFVVVGDVVFENVVDSGIDVALDVECLG